MQKIIKYVDLARFLPIMHCLEEYFNVNIAKYDIF